MKTQKQRAALRAKLDRQFQERVCRIPVCAICGSRLGVSAHHITRKSRCHGKIRHLRHAVKNGLPLCIDCHNSVHDGSLDKKAFMQWLRTHRPEQYAWLVKEGGIVDE